ncbi:NAD(P)/FAD-dependent oxidoreductase [soil metagenome]
MNEPDVVIVGAGLAGLSCGRILSQRGKNTLILDASDGIGGRVRTDRLDGFLLDRGFQVLLTAYPEAQAQLDYNKLTLGSFTPGALVWNGRDFHRVSDPLRDPLASVKTVLSPVGTLADKLRTGILRYRVTSGSLETLMERPETWTYSSLRAQGFSGDMIESFYRPFLAGVFLETELETSSRFFDFVFRMFSLGDTSLPAQGMEAIPRQLVETLPDGSIRLNTKVDRIEQGRVILSSGEEIRAGSVVVATEGDEAARLLGWPAARQPKSMTCIYFSSPEPPVRKPILVLNGSGKGLINNVCVPDQVVAEYAPEGRSLVSVSLVGLPEVEGGIEGAVQKELQDWFGPLAKHFQHLKTYRVPYSLPDQSSGMLSPVEKSVTVAPGIFVAGDHRGTASIDGALGSGRRAAEAILQG